MDVLVISLIIVITLQSYFILRFEKKITQLFRTPDERVESPEHSDELSTYELMRLQREEEFDDRINRLKDEIAFQQDVIRRVGTTADELHPLVHNLPHDAIDTRLYSLPDVEVSE